jgi:hypothetical protein
MFDIKALVKLSLEYLDYVKMLQIVVLNGLLELRDHSMKARQVYLDMIFKHLANIPRTAPREN